MKKVIGTIICKEKDAEMIYNLLTACLQFIQTVMKNTVGIELDLKDKEEKCVHDKE